MSSRRFPTFLSLVALTALAAACAQRPTTYDDAIAEAACGQCQLGLEGEGCDLAIRIDGQAWYVDGTGIDDHGDAHGDDGFCNAIRAARVSGQVEGERFVVTSFELLPAE